ncbi:MAG: serine hydrolase domain-containing protein [Gemmobacter sp.]|nr:serine hydrolase domain-containing protein [Gemmobacter sp.]
MHAVSIAAGIVAMLGSALPATGQTVTDVSARLAATLQDFHTSYGFPAATASIALPDGRIVTAATGLADIETGRTMTPETPMLAASVGKTFVAATILALESEGRLSRSDLLAEHLGNRAWFDRLPNAESIAIDHLLHHTAGLPDHVHLPAFQAAWAQMMQGNRVNGPEDLVGFIAGLQPLTDAGSAWAYSDTRYILLGLVIEQVTSQRYHDGLRARFLDPLALTGTFASDRPDLSGLAVGYVAPDNPFGLPERTADTKGRLLWDPAVEWTGGGPASTAPDLARWGHLLFGGAAMTQQYLDRLLDAVQVAPKDRDTLYGAGVAIQTTIRDGRIYGHGGWVPGYVSSLRHYEDHGIAITFQINTDAGLRDGTSDLVPTREASLADLVIGSVR